jgi:hypothetical protein
MQPYPEQQGYVEQGPHRNHQESQQHNKRNELQQPQEPQTHTQIVYREPPPVDLDLKISLVSLSHPAKKLLMRTHLRELFTATKANANSGYSSDGSNGGSFDTAVDFKLVKNRLIKSLDEAQQLSSSFPYLPHDGVTWKDLMKFFNYSERFKRPRSEAISLTVEVLLVKTGHSCKMTCEVGSWIQVASKQVCMCFLYQT